MSDKREELAALEHDQWAHWTRHMLEVLEPLLAYGRGAISAIARREIENGFTVPDPERAEQAIRRWNRQINTPYEALTEKEQESDRVWADKVLEVTGTASPLDGDIIRVVQSIFSHAHFVVETPNEATLVRLMEERGNPIDIDGSVTPIEADYQRYLKDKEKPAKKTLVKVGERWVEEDLHHSLLLKIADIIDSQLRLEDQCPGASQLGPGTVAAAIRTAVKNHNKEA